MQLDSHNVPLQHKYKCLILQPWRASDHTTVHLLHVSLIYHSSCPSPTSPPFLPCSLLLVSSLHHPLSPSASLLLTSMHLAYLLIYLSLSFLHLQPTSHHCCTLLLSPRAPMPCLACPNLSPWTSRHLFIAPQALPLQGLRVLPVLGTSDILCLVWSSLCTPNQEQVFALEALTHSCLLSMVG